MARISRRDLLQAALALSATAAWASAMGRRSKIEWHEKREFFPEGVASGDPDHSSVLLWTRRPFLHQGEKSLLILEVAKDPVFQRVVATTKVFASQEADWTCRVLVGGLDPASVYWYRFTDSLGNGSRVGRTITAPAPEEDRPVRFAFVSCQNANQGAQNAYRRMIFEDEHAAECDRLDFVLHLGDFIYELVWYPEDRPRGMYDRRLRDIVRYPAGEKISDFHVPTNVQDYRAVYRAYLHDPDLQDARARWPFVNMWDNHEFSWKGWQSFQKFDDGITRPAQTRKVAANQAFFEYQPARISKPSGASLEHFAPPRVTDTPVLDFDEYGMGQEPDNLAAIESLQGYRTLRWGQHVQLIVTDQRSYRSEDPLDRKEADPFFNKDFPEFIPEEAIGILDAGKAYNEGNPPEIIAYGDSTIPNFRRTSPPQTILGAEQKQWFLEQLVKSKATWKIWGNTTATLEMRADLQNLPEGLTKPWAGEGYAGCASNDHSVALMERSEIYDFVQSRGITNFATVAGDRHSFWAGLAVKSLPPKVASPVGVAFVVGSISAPGLVEALEHGLPKDHPLRPLYLGQATIDDRPQPTINMLLRNGVNSCLEYQRTGDIEQARLAKNPQLAPHLSFVDMGGHGYAVVRADAKALETEFVCIPRPLERSQTIDGGQVLYRVKFSTPAWRSGDVPQIITKITQGNPRFSFG